MSNTESSVTWECDEAIVKGNMPLRTAYWIQRSGTLTSNNNILLSKSPFEACHDSVLAPCISHVWE